MTIWFMQGTTLSIHIGGLSYYKNAKFGSRYDTFPF